MQKDDIAAFSQHSQGSLAAWNWFCGPKNTLMPKLNEYQLSIALRLGLITTSEFKRLTP